MPTLDGISVGEAGFRFVVETGMDATGYDSVVVSIKRPRGNAQLDKTAQEQNADGGLSGEFYFVPVATDFDTEGIYSIRTTINKPGGIVLKSYWVPITVRT